MSSRDTADIANDFVVTIACTSVDELITELSPRKERYCSILPREWLYRGISNDREYDLTPSALRKGSSDLSGMTGERIVTNANQCHAERQALIDFLRIADSVGLHIPEDTQALRTMLQQGAALPNEWPPPEVLSVMALARHHGVPARLLDWSRHPLKAAWFAASGALRSDDKVGLLSVWALCADPIRVRDELPLPFTVITAPSATNSNLRAQEGVFTAPKPIQPNKEAIDRRPFDEQLRASVAEAELRITGPWFYRVTLPSIHADDLFFALALEGVTRASLFPNFDGVVGEMRDLARLYWTDGAPGRKRVEEHLKAFSMSHRVNLTYGELLAYLFPPPPPPQPAISTMDLPTQRVQYRLSGGFAKGTWEGF